MAYPPVLPPAGRTNATPQLDAHPSDHNLIAAALAAMPWGLVAPPVILSGGAQSIPATAVTDVTGLTLTFVRRADRRYVARWTLQLQQQTAAAVPNIYLMDGANATWTFRGLTMVAAQYFALSDFFEVSGAAGTVTVKVRANTPAGTLQVANGSSPSVLLVEDVGPKP